MTRDRVSVIPGSSEFNETKEEIANHHLKIQQKIRECGENYPLIGSKLWTVVSEILGREFVPAKEVLWQLNGRIHKPEKALQFFEEKLEEGRKKAMEERARTFVDPALSRASDRLLTPVGSRGPKPNPTENLRSKVRTLLGGTIAEITAAQEREKLKK